AALSLQTTMLGNQEKRAQTLKANSDAKEAASRAQTAMLDYFGNQAAGIAKNGYNPAAIEAMLHNAETMNPDYAPHVQAIRSQLEKDPASAKQIIDGLVSASLNATREQREQTTAKLTNDKTRQDIAAGRRNQAIQELSGITDRQTGAVN